MLCEVIGSDCKSCTERAVACVWSESIAGYGAHGVQRMMRSSLRWCVRGGASRSDEGEIGAARGDAACEREAYARSRNRSRHTQDGYGEGGREGAKGFRALPTYLARASPLSTTLQASTTSFIIKHARTPYRLCSPTMSSVKVTLNSTLPALLEKACNAVKLRASAGTPDEPK